MVMYRVLVHLWQYSKQVRHDKDCVDVSTSIALLVLHQSFTGSVDASEVAAALAVSAPLSTDKEVSYVPDVAVHAPCVV